MKKILLFPLLMPLAAGAFAEGITPSAKIAASPAEYYGKPLCLRGAVESARKISAPDGQYLLVAIKEAGHSSHAVMKSSETYAAGLSITACGTFMREVKAGAEIFQNALSATSAVVRPPRKPAKILKPRRPAAR